MKKLLLVVISCMVMLQALSATIISQEELLQSFLRFLPQWVDASADSSVKDRVVPYIDGMSVRETWTTPQSKVIILQEKDTSAAIEKIICTYFENNGKKYLKNIDVDPSTQITLSYDELLRLIAVNFKNSTTKLHYDSKGCIQKIQEPNGEEIYFSSEGSSPRQLVVRKVTKDGVSRSIFSKNGNVELAVLDNGTGEQSDDYTNVTWRHWKRKTFSPCEKIILLEDGVVDIDTRKERLVSTISFLYRETGTLLQTKAISAKQQQETITDYDEKERVVRVENCKESASISYAEVWDSTNNEMTSVQTIYDRNGSCIEKRETQTGNYKEFIKKDLNGNAIYRETKSYDKNTKKLKKERVIYSPQNEIIGYEGYEWGKNSNDKLEYISQITPSGKSRTTFYQYSPKGRAFCKTKPDGVKIYYTYEKGKLKKISSSDASVDYEISYNTDGQIVNVYDGINHTQYNRIVSEAGEVVTESYEGIHLQFTSKGKKRFSTSLPDGSTIFYDGYGDEEKIIYKGADGVIKFETNTNIARIHKIEETPSVSNYTFNEIGQLTTKCGKEVIRDDFGNVINDSSSQYLYDDNGNLIQKDNLHYYYDALNRLQKVEIDGKLQAAFVYDVFNRKIKEKIYSDDGSLAKEKIYIWDGFEEIGEIVDGSIQNLRFVSTPGAALTASTRAIYARGDYFLTEIDARGSIISVHELQSKRAVEKYTYDIYGNFLDGNEEGLSPWRYSGKRLCCHSKALYYGQRHYMPAISRWMSHDPLTFVDGGNQTAFAKGDPLNNIDYQGLFSWPAILSSVKTEIVKGLTNIVQGSIDSLTFAQESLDWFIDFRSHFEDMAFRAFEKSFFTYMGYNPHEMHQGDVGRNLSDKVRITSINGILNAYETAIVNSKLISDLHGGALVHYIYSKTEGFSADLLRCLVIKAGFVSLQAKELASTWKRLIHEMGGVNGGGTIIHYAHSLGGADTLAALNLLDSNEKKMIRITTFGSAALIPNAYAHSVLNYVSTNDAIPAIADPIRYLFAAYGKSDNIAFVNSKNGLPLVDHFLNGDTYTSILEELGHEYQNSYLDDESRVKEAPFLSLKHKGLLRLPKANPSDKIAELIGQKNFRVLGKKIVQYWGNEITRDSLVELATQSNCQVLLVAIDSAVHIRALGEEIGLSEPKLIQACLYIESEILSKTPDKNCYLKSKDTGISADIEYYHKKGCVFIHKSENPSSYIGRGAWKIVTKSILYDRDKSQIVARCVSRAGNKLETKIHSQLSKCEGLVETIAQIPRKYIHGKMAYDIILKYYNVRSFRRFLFSNDHKNLDVSQRMQLCASLTKGLATMHSKNIAHRDISKYNCLIHKEQNSLIHKIDYQIALCDFGQSRPISICKGITAQFSRFYRAPEAIRFCDLKGKDYFATDVFAVGCLVYQLFYSKQPDWFLNRYYPVSGSSETTRERAQKKLAAVIYKVMQGKLKTVLQKQKMKMALTPSEKFQKCIFLMLHPDPKKRICAKRAHKLMAEIISSAN